MSKTLISPAQIKHLALAYNKSPEFIEECAKFHGVTELPKYRYDGDGLSDFYSDLTSVHFDPDFVVEVEVDGKIKPWRPDASMTKGEFTAECDLNTIMARYTASNFDPSCLPMSTKRALYGDFTQLPESYHVALSMVLDTQRSFMTLPAELRAKFDNDPQKFIDFCADEANYQELLDLGLATPRIPSVAESINNGVSEGIIAAAAAGYLPTSNPSEKPVSGKKKPASGGAGD